MKSELQPCTLVNNGQQIGRCLTRLSPVFAQRKRPYCSKGIYRDPFETPIEAGRGSQNPQLQLGSSSRALVGSSKIRHLGFVERASVRVQACGRFVGLYMSYSLNRLKPLKGVVQGII